MSDNRSAKGSATNVTVGMTPVSLSAGMVQGRSFLVFNNSTTATLYVGYTNGVSATNGMPVLPGGGLEFEDYVGQVWAVASAAGTDVRLMGVGG